MAVPISTHIFRFAGGFSVTELLMPNGSSLLSPSPAHQSPPQAGAKGSSGFDGITRWFQGGKGSRAAVHSTTLEQDLAKYTQEYRWLASGLALTLVFCGGNGAILGSITSVVLSGTSGKDRYVSVKRWINEHS